MAVRYDLNRVVVVVAGVPITEFSADGISHAYDGDDCVFSQGSHGSVIKSNKFNNISTLTLNLMQGSPANSVLSDLREAGVFTGFFSVIVRDTLSSDTYISCAQASILKMPDLNFGEEAGAHDWQFKLTNPTVRAGTNTP